jgi:DNA-binding response OmpR family regulator
MTDRYAPSVPRRRSELSDSKRVKALVVDDDRFIAETLRRYLSKRDIEVTMTTSPEDASSLIQREKFDVLISDVMMEPISGIDLVKRLRSLSSGCKVILISGVCQENEIRNWMETLKIDKLFTKPFRLNDVYEKLMELTHENCRR